MASNAEIQSLLAQMDKKRDATRWYLGKLKEVDPKLEVEVNGVKLNSYLWIAAHIAWSENGLIHYNCGGNPVDIPWLKQFAIGKARHSIEHWPTIREAIDALKLVRQRTQDHLNTLTDEVLDQPVAKPTPLYANYRDAFYHALWHEGVHTGHLGWLCKIHEVATI